MTISRNATLHRAQILVDAVGYLDRDRANAFLEAVRTENDDEPVPTVILTWLADFGQSSDWLYSGSIHGMVHALAKRAKETVELRAENERLRADNKRLRAALEAQLTT